MRLPVHNERFNRANRYDPLRSADPFSGPYLRPSNSLLRRAANCLGYIVGTGLLVAVLFAPRIWAALIGGQ